MKLSPSSIQNLERLLQTCSIADIDAIIIEDNTIRGVNEDKSCVIISDQNVPELKEGTKMGLSRLGILNNRLSLFKNDPQMVVDAKENSRDEISALEISSPSAKVQFRCTAPGLIKAPKKINDEFAFSIKVEKEQIPFILSGAKSMSPKRVVIAGKDDGIYFEFTDTNQDTFSIKVDEPTLRIFAIQLPATVFLALIRASVNNNEEDKYITLNVGKIGTVNLLVNNYTMTILPQVQE